MPRLFVALHLPQWVKREVLSLSPAIPGARPTPEDNLHLTLSFIGEVDAHDAEDLARDLGFLSAPPFFLTLRGVGHFPPRGAPRSLWVGLEPSQPLINLQRKVDRAIENLGLPTEDRKFHPHITLARLRDAPEVRVAAFLGAHTLFKCGPFEVDAFHLMSSTRGPAGSAYETEETYPLHRTGGLAIQFAEEDEGLEEAP